MPKLKKTLVLEREAFVTSLFKAESNLSIPKANKLVIAKFGAMMRPQRLYQLRNLTTAEASETTATPPSV